MTEEYKSEFTFTLIKPVTYQEKGQAGVVSTEIRLMAPSNKQRRQVAILKEGFFGAIDETQSKNKLSKEEIASAKEDIAATEEDDAFGVPQILYLLLSAKSVDLNKYQEAFRELLLNEIAWVSETQKLTAPIYDELSIDDTESMMGEYISNFLLSSWMKKL